jgi:hypothetical protein
MQLLNLPANGRSKLEWPKKVLKTCWSIGNKETLTKYAPLLFALSVRNLRNNCQKNWKTFHSHHLGPDLYIYVKNVQSISWYSPLNKVNKKARIHSIMKNSYSRNLYNIDCNSNVWKNWKSLCQLSVFFFIPSFVNPFLPPSSSLTQLAPRPLAQFPQVSVSPVCTGG